MRNSLRIGTYAALAALVIIVGILGGWYFFLRSENTTTTGADSARGFGAAAPLGNQNGSTYANIAEQIAGSAQPNAPAGSEAPRMWHASKAPVAGFGFVTVGSSTRIYFVERATGYIFSADMQTSAVTRLTNTLLPKTYEAHVSADGSALLQRIGDDGSIETLSGRVPPVSSSSPSAFMNTSLPKGIRALASDPTNRTLFYIAGGAAAGVGTTAAWDGSKPVQAFASGIGAWRPFILSDGRLVVAEAAEDGVSGYAYEIGKNGGLTSLVRDVPGLTVLPRTGGALIYGSSGSALALYAQPKADTPSISLPIKTVAEKCAWAQGSALVAYCAVPMNAPAAGFLGSWYRGTVHTHDAWWRVDASAGTATMIYSPAENESQGNADVIDPMVGSSGEYLAFIDNIDQSLWVLRIKE